MNPTESQAALIINTVSKENFNDLCATISSDVEKNQLYIVHSDNDVDTVVPSKKYTDEKIYVQTYVEDEKVEGYTNLSVLKVSEDEYERFVAEHEDTELSNILFMVSSDNMNMHNFEINNVAVSVDEDGVGQYIGNAATVPYVEYLVDQLEQKIIGDIGQDLDNILNN